MSKKISRFTLKNTLNQNDVLAILDSEANYKNKKILASVLSGGGGDFDYYHELTNVQMTFNSGAYQISRITADCDNLTAYVPGIYVLKSSVTNSVSSGDGVTLNINNLGNTRCTLLNGGTAGGSSSANPLPRAYFVTDGIYIFVYYNNTFYNVYASTVHIKQAVTTYSGDTQGVDLSSLSEQHQCIKYTTPLTSLTLGNAPIQNQGFEQEFQFTTGATFAFTAAGLQGKWIGGEPTFEANKSYVIAIKNGIAAWGEIS